MRGQFVLFAEIPCLLRDRPLRRAFPFTTIIAASAAADCLFCFADKVKITRCIQDIDLMCRAQMIGIMDVLIENFLFTSSLSKSLTVFPVSYASQVGDS